MNYLSPFAALLITLSLFAAACSDATTDADLPEGTATSEAPSRETSEAQQQPDRQQPAAEEDTQKPDAPDESADTTAVTLSEERQSATGFTYRLPEGWSVGPDKPMRALTLIPPADEFPGAELAMFRWPGRVGGFAGNVTRWAGQVGVTPPSLTRTDYEQLDVSGTPSAYIPLANKDSNSAVLALWVPLGDDPDGEGVTWTPKLTCTAEQALKLEDAFKAWAGSVKFE